MRCQNCGNHVVQKKGGKVVLRVKGKIEFEDDNCAAKCYWCGSPVTFFFPLGDVSNLEQIRFVVNR